MVSKTEVISKVMEVLDDNCDRPSQELNQLGNSLISIASALEGKSLAEATAIMKSVALLLPTTKT